MAIDTRLIYQLSSEDPKERRKAIIALADSRNPEALKLLDESAKMDPERKIREVAERAFKHLKEQIDRATNPNAVKPVVIPEQQLQRARQYVEGAMSAYIAKDEATATRSLTRALQLNPNLKTDQYFLSMVSNVLNMDPQEGLAVLISGEKRGEFIEKAKNQKVQQHKDEHKAQTKELGWDALAFDLGVYGMVITAIAFLAPFVVNQLVAKTIT
jgi:HEAT repeats